MSNQQVSDQSDAPGGDVSVRPIPDAESDIGKRIASLIPEDESQNSFARRCGIGETTLRKYLGGAQPSTDRLVAMADIAGVSIEWLAAGRGPRQRQRAQPEVISDRDRLVTAIRAVEQGLALIGRTMAPDKKAELILAAYELISQDDATAQAAQSAKIIQFIKLAA